MKTRHIFLILLLMLFAPAACTKEDYRNCPAGLYITFEPINPKHIFSEQVQNVSLYFYDPANGELKEHFDYTKEDLRPSDHAAFVPQIPSGTYKVVAVVNSGIYSRTMEPENYGTLHMILDGEGLDYKPADLYTSEKEIEITVNTSPVIPEENMLLAKHNNNIHLNIVFDGYETRTGITLDSHISGSNARFDFADYSCPGTHAARYGYWATRNNEENGLPERLSHTTMRLWHGGDVTLHLSEQAATRAERGTISLNIADELARVMDDGGDYLYDTDEELEYQDEYEITIRLGKGFVVLGITINDWDVVGGGVDL